MQRENALGLTTHLPNMAGAPHTLERNASRPTSTLKLVQTLCETPHLGGLIPEVSSRRSHLGDLISEISSRRSHLGGLISEISSRRSHLGDLISVHPHDESPAFAGCGRTNRRTCLGIDTARQSDLVLTRVKPYEKSWAQSSVGVPAVYSRWAAVTNGFWCRGCRRAPRAAAARRPPPHQCGKDEEGVLEAHATYEKKCPPS